MVKIVFFTLALLVCINLQIKESEGLNLMADLARKLHIGKFELIKLFKSYLII